MQRAFAVAASLWNAQVRAANTSTSLLAQRGSYKLFRAGDERLIEPRFAAIRSIFVNDPALGSFIDSCD
jgi:hypothetical protein